MMSKALPALAAFVAALLLGACNNYDSTESAADLSKQLEQYPTAAGPSCVRNVTLLKQQGAPEAAIRNVSGCSQPGI